MKKMAKFISCPVFARFPKGSEVGSFSIKTGPVISDIAPVFGILDAVAGEWRRSHTVKLGLAAHIQSSFIRFFHASTCLIKIRSYSSIHDGGVKCQKKSSTQQ